MTKVEYASIYAAIAAIVIAFMLYIGKDAGKKGIQVRRQLHAILVMDVIYFVSFFISDITLLEWNYSLVQAIEGWISFMFIYFGLRFAATKEAWLKKAVNIILGLCIADTVLLLANASSHFLFAFTVGQLEDGSVYVLPEVNVFFVMHTVFCYLLEIGFVFMMVREAVRASRLYRSKYVILSSFFAIGIIACVIARASGLLFNFPAVIVLSFGACVIFYVYFHLPKMRVEKMKNFVLKNVTLPILMFDCDDELALMNEPAKTITGMHIGDRLTNYIEGNDLKTILTPERRAEGKTKEFTLTIKSDGTAYLIHGQELWDLKGYFVGTLLVYNDISKQEKLKDEATYHATRDALTGLWNREYFHEVAKSVLDADPDRDYAIIVSNIQHFKMFNEILGRTVGDDLLIAIADKFRERYRENWVFAHVSADKFVLLMPKEDYDEQRFVSICKSAIEQRKYGLAVKFYLGVYFVEKRDIAVADMCNRAYMALEAVKGNPNRVVAYYNEEIRNKMIHETVNATELDCAIRQNEFTIFLQPQVDSRTNRIVGSEALVRWISPTRGMVSPIEFIPSFEDNGMIAELDRYVWEMACMTLKRWKDSGMDYCPVSVNISAKDFYLSDIYTSLTELVEKYNVSAKDLRLEITESAFVLNVEEQKNLVKRLQKYGFVVEIDDFGSGYSSLNSLKNIEADMLKLDMKFFEKTEDTDRAEKIIESVVDLAYNLKMPVIAEGVEEKEQIEMLQRIGCNIIQGYYYAKPMPVEEYESFFKKYNLGDNCERI